MDYKNVIFVDLVSDKCNKVYMFLKFSDCSDKVIDYKIEEYCEVLRNMKKIINIEMKTENTLFLYFNDFIYRVDNIDQNLILKFKKRFEDLIKLQSESQLLCNKKMKKLSLFKT